MRLSIGFSTLLVSVLYATSVVDGRPAKRDAGMVTLPLRSVQKARDDVHPMILFQQHHNRATRRHARMTGGQEPTDLELRDRLLKRIVSVEASGAETGLAKRYWTDGYVGGALDKLRAGAHKSSKTNSAKVKAAKAAAKATSPKKNVAAAKGLKKNVAATKGSKQNVAAAKGSKGQGHKAHSIVDKHFGHGKDDNNDDFALGDETQDDSGAAEDSQDDSGAEDSQDDSGAGDSQDDAGQDGSDDTDDAEDDSGDTQDDTTGDEQDNTGDNAGEDSTDLNDSTADLGGPGFSAENLDAALQGGLTKAGDPTADDSLGLDIEANDVGYIADVQIGNPPRSFAILMDSGSADFWVGGENCQSEDGSGDCGNHVFLGAQSSKTFQDSGKPFEVQYGSGDVQGTIITDDINVAGLKLNAHTFGVATQESVDFSSNNTPFDGLMGLAQSTLSNQGVLTPPEALAQQGLINDAIVSYKISRLADGKNDGQITFGGLDQTKFDPQTLVSFANVNKDGFWEGDLAVSVDGNGVLNGKTAILDTGTSLIVAPPDDAQAFHDAIPGAKSDGQGGFTIPCTTSVNVEFTIGGGTFAINPQDLLFVPVDQNDLTGDCVSGVSAGNIGGADEWLVGDVFLKNVYFSHDVQKNEISLAKLV